MTDTAPAVPADLLERLAEAGNKALNDHYHEAVCYCPNWPKSCASTGHSNYFFGYWDTSAFDIGLPAIIAAYEQHKAQQAHEAQHADCIEPHRTADGYTDCDGRPL